MWKHKQDNNCSDYILDHITWLILKHRQVLNYNYWYAKITCHCLHYSCTLALFLLRQKVTFWFQCSYILCHDLVLRLGQQWTYWRMAMLMFKEEKHRSISLNQVTWFRKRRWQWQWPNREPSDLDIVYSNLFEGDLLLHAGQRRPQKVSWVYWCAWLW